MRTCDNWVVLKIIPNAPDEKDSFYKLLVGTSGGYLDGNSWRLNSGIVKCEKNEDGDYEFSGHSGSIYLCRPSQCVMRMNNAQIYEQMKDEYGDKVMLMDDRDDWTKFDWNVKDAVSA